jgi:hypothetical protein
MCTPRVFVHHVTGAALGLCGIRFAIVQGLNARDMTRGIKGAMNMATLAVFRDDLVAGIWRQGPLQGFVQRIDLAGREAQERDHKTYCTKETHGKPLSKEQGSRAREKERETGFEPATFSLGS